MQPKIDVNLGDECRDTVSGFRGIAVGVYTFLNGCSRVCLQPKVGKDGKLPESGIFDAPQLEVIKRAVVHAGPRNTGGPCPYPIK